MCSELNPILRPRLRIELVLNIIEIVGTHKRILYYHCVPDGLVSIPAVSV